MSSGARRNRSPQTIAPGLDDPDEPDRVCGKVDVENPGVPIQLFRSLTGATGAFAAQEFWISPFGNVPTVLALMLRCAMHC